MVSFRSIKLTNGRQMVELQLDPKADGPRAIVEPTAEGLSLDEMAAIYHRENNLVRGANPLPFVFISRLERLDDLSIILDHQSYQVPQEFQSFCETALRKGNQSRSGSVISVDDLVQQEGKTTLFVRPATYHDIIRTNLAQDMELPSDIDFSFYGRDYQPEITWRKLEAPNGVPVPLKDSRMVNYLGIGYLILTHDGKNILMALRKRLPVEGGTIGLMGSTPDFVDDIKAGKPVADIFESYIREQLDKKEISLKSDEYQLGSMYIFRDLLRGVLLVPEIKLRIEPQILAQRSAQNLDALRQHSHLYVAPFDSVAMRVLERGLEIPGEGKTLVSVNTGTLAAAYTALKKP